MSAAQADIEDRTAVGRTLSAPNVRFPRHEWTPELDARLRELWPLGHGKRRIAKEIGMTPSTVATRANRLGLAVHERAPTSTSIAREAKRAAAPVAQQVASPPPAPPSPPAITKSLPLRTTIPGVRECQWPIGEPKRPGFHFCGRPDVVAGKPYCEEHYKVAYETTRGADD